MTENEAIKVIQTEKSCVLRNIDGCDRDCGKCDLVMEDKEIIFGYDMAISALSEIQQYRTIGTVEEIEPYIRLAEKLNVCDLVRENAGLSNKIKFLELELESYKKIGTVTECRAAMEKQRPKKPIKGVCCPSCGWIVFSDEKGHEDIPHCISCGQALDWSDSK